MGSGIPGVLLHIYKKGNRPIKQVPPIREENGSWARDNKQKPDMFVSHLENILQLNKYLMEIELTDLA